MTVVHNAFRKTHTLFRHLRKSNDGTRHGHSKQLSAKPRKLNFSRTRTLLKRHKMEGPVTRETGPVSKSFTRYNSHKDPIPKGMRKITATHHFWFNGSTSLAGTGGYLSIGGTTSTFGQVDCNTLFGNILPFVTSGTQTYQGTVSRLLLHSMANEFLIANATNGTMKMDIYDCIARKDSNITPDQAWANGFAQTPILGGIGSSGDDIVYGSNPFQSRQFVEYYNVVRKTTVDMEAGANHKHNVIWKPNKVIDLAKFSNGQAYSKGLSIFTFFVLTGFPVANASEIVTIGSTKINICYKRLIGVQAIGGQTETYGYTNGLLSYAGGSLINDLTATKVNEIQT